MKTRIWAAGMLMVLALTAARERAEAQLNITTPRNYFTVVVKDTLDNIKQGLSAVHLPDDFICPLGYEA